MMYISVYPIAMSVRNTNVYEEQSLGLFGDDDTDDVEQGDELENNLSSGRHVRAAVLVIVGSMFYLVFPGLGSIPRLSCSETACI
jgi:Trk-type K+ transport system membrane component